MNMVSNIKSKVMQGLLYIILFLFSLAFLIPFLQVVISSFMSQADVMENGAYSLIPRSFDLTAYKLIFSNKAVLTGAIISVMRTGIGTLLNLVVTAMLAFGLSQKGLPGRNFIITLLFITMIFGGGLIPTYMVVNTLRLTNTFWAMIVPSLLSVYYFILMKTFFQNLPQSLQEAAIIDGASAFQYFVKIALPLSKPMLATIGLFYAVGHWNSWFDASIYINDYAKMPLQVLLKDTIVKFSQTNLNLGLASMNPASRPPSVALRSALIVVTTLPIICVYPALQKYFVKGIMLGSIKG